MLEITSVEQLQSVLQAETAVIDFWSPACGPCRLLNPLYQSLAEQMPGVTFAKVNAPEQMDIAKQFGVRSMPTVIVFRNGEPKTTLIGMKSEVEYKAAIEG